MTANAGIRRGNGTHGRATVEPNSDPVSVTFDDDADVGIDVKAWWVSEPRQ